jgi:hypothetical protein
MIISGTTLYNVGYVVDTQPVSTHVATGLQLHLDAGNVSSYPGTGSTWTDLVGSKAFTLYNTPTYSSNNGGYLSFVPASGQYAASSTSLASQSTWTVEAWHYYAGTNIGSLTCLVTETFVGGGINYTLGWPTGGPNFQAGFFNGAWRTTPTGYTPASNAWYQIVGTYDGTTIKLYVNNTLINQTAYTGTPTSSAAGIRLMRRWDNAEYWGGRLGVVRIYNTALTATQIGQNFAAQRSRFGI